MSNLWKRSLSFALALMMVVSMVPMQAFATETETEETTLTEVLPEETAAATEAPVIEETEAPAESEVPEETEIPEEPSAPVIIEEITVIIDEAANEAAEEPDAADVAMVGETGYETLADAIAAAASGDTVTLLCDVATSEIITINKAITLDGNGKVLTSTAARAINVETSGNVVISNLTIQAGERAINIINQPANVTLNKVTATAKNNAVMLATSAENANLTVNDSHLTGLATVNVASANSVVTINDTTIVNVDASAAENYGAITVWTSAENANVTVNGGEIIVADDSRKAYVFPGSATVKGVDDIGYIIATVGDAGYESLEKAIEEAKNGDTVKLMRNVTASEIISIDKAITLDGNGKKLTSTAGRAINVTGAAANGVTIKNLTINVSGERGINVIQNANNVRIENCTIKAANYAVNATNTAPGAVITIVNSDLTGLNVVNIASANAEVTVTNTKILCNDQSATENYSALTLNQDAVGASIVATDVTFDIKGDSRISSNDAEGGSIVVNGNSGNEAEHVAIIEYGNYYYGFTTLEGAIEKAVAGETIKLLRDVTASEIITINKAITLDGNGKTLTSTAARAINVETSGNVVISNLTIQAGERAINIINQPANVTLNKVTATAKNKAVMLATSAENANLTVNDSHLTGLATVNVASANSVVEINDTTIVNVDASAAENYGAITVWTSAENANVTVNGGEIIVADDSRKAYVFPGSATVKGVDDIGYIIATVGDAGYESLEKAIEEAKNGDTVKLMRNVTASAIITINKAITLDGNGKTLTSTAARAINVETSGNVVISDLTIKAGERAINIINQPANVTLNKVTATAKNNAVMLATSAENANLTVNDSHLTGLATVNVASANSVVTINDTTIVNVDASAAENYGAITVWTSAENANVTVNGGEIIVADDSRKAYVFPANATVNGVDDIGYIVVTVGDAGFDTLEEAIGYAKAGQTLEMVRDVTASAIITINKAITLDGNGKKLTSTAARAINVSGADGVTIKNLTIDVTGERGINVIQNATNVLIEDCTIKAANYTVNAASSAPGAVITIKNSDLTGLNVVNIGAPNAKVTVTDGTILCNDQNENEGYGALSLNKDAVGGSIVANGVAFAIMGNSNKAVNAAEGGSIIIDGQDSEAIIDVAVVEYGNYYYGFDTVEKAIEYATAGETVKLIRDVTASAIITIDKAITLDGNGKTLTSTAARAINVETSGNVVISNLTIQAGERAINIINQPANVTLNKVTATAKNNAVMLATSAENANLTVNDSHLTGLATVNVASANSVVTINDTTIVNVDASAAENYGAITIWTSAENANVTVSGGEIIVADDSRKAYVFPGSATVKGVDDIGYIIATVGDAGYESLEKAIEEAKNGDTVKLMRNVTASEIISIDKAITLDGNGKTLTSTAARAINVETSGNVVISNLTIQAGERAINIINQPANVTLNKVTATAKNNAVMLATSAENANLTVNDSHLTGLATVNVASANSVVTINDTTIVNVDASAAENYGAITVWTSAENANVTVNGGEIIVADDSRKAYVFPGSATVKGVDDIGYIIATVGDAGYESLEKAIEEAKNGETIEMMRGLTIPQDATVTLDLMGKTVSLNVAATTTSALITNNGTLTVKDSVGGGKLVYASSVVNTGYSTSTIINNGTLTVESGIIENNSPVGGATYAIDNYNTLTVNGGTFTTNRITVRQAQFGNHDNIVTINGGEFTGYAGLQLHVFSTAKKTTTVINGGTFNGTYAMFTAFDAAEDSGNTDITINGGTFSGTYALLLCNHNAGAAELNAAVKGGNFNGGVYAYICDAAGNVVNLPIVSGGIFSEIAMNETDPAVLAENLVFVADENGNYHVEETAFPLMINHSYIAIEIDKTFDLDVVANPDGGVYSVVWDVESDKGIIEVDQNGLVTAKKVGTDYVLATIGSGDNKVTARCRVDVTEEDIKIEAVQLSTNKVTTELFSTNYAKLDVILLLEQNQPDEMTKSANVITDNATNGVVGLNEEDAGLSITAAKFKNDAYNELFTLEIVDDRTLQIVPKTEKVLENPGLFKSSYKSEIVLTIRGEEITTELVSLTVKKTKPSVKATVAAFNSFYTNETRQIVFTGATVEKVALNPAKALPAAWLTVAGPAPAVEDEINWMNPDDVTLSLTDGLAPVKSTSTNVYLKVMTAEWVIPVDVTLAVKNTYKARSLKLSASSISISAENSTGITLTLKPGNAKETWESLNVRDIEVVTDGFNVDTTNLIENGTFVLNTDQTFTNQVLQLKVLFNDTEAKLALPNLKVKQVAPKITMAPTTVKLNTKIDDSVTVKLTATPADFQIGDVTLSLTDRNNKPVAENFDKLDYTIDPVTNEVTVKTAATTVSNEVYYLYAAAGSAKAKLTIQTIGKNPSMSLTAKGNIDLSFPETSAVITTKLANCNLPAADDLSIVITNSKKADVTEYFDIKPAADGYEILAGEGLEAGTYTATITALLNEGDVDEIKLVKTAKITVKRTAVKLKLTTSKVSLNKKLGDVATVGVSCTTKGYEFVEPFLTYDATKLDVQYVDGNLLVKAVAEAGTRDQTYKVTVRAHEGATSAVTLNVVVLKKDAVVKSTIKATGMIDVIRDNTMITIKPTYTNALNVDVENQAQLVFYSNANKDNYKTPIAAEDVPFDVTVEDGVFVLTANEKLLATVSYKVELVTTFCEKPSAKIALSVKMNNAKLVMHAEKTNKMYAQDINSRVTFSVASTDATVNEIRTVEVLDSKLSAAYRGIFKVIEYGNGEYAIGFVEGANISKVQGKTINVPVNVFIEGNESTKTNATLTLKITVVK